MKVIAVDNVNGALYEGLTHLLRWGEELPSRNGAVLVAPSPVCTAYTTPQRRVVFSPLRDANPFFHLMEAIWMMAGNNDVKWPSYFAKNIANYSDDGKTLWGAYGFRWRNWFEFDQLLAIIDELRSNPQSRRVVLSMWDGAEDLDRATDGGKDVPCNTHAYFEVRHGMLNMTVCNRSNDVIWGAYGANAVHFSVLQEFIALSIGARVGTYYQFSNNYHVYLDKYPREKLMALRDDVYAHDAYRIAGGTYPHLPLINGTAPEVWLEQAERFVEDPYEEVEGADPFFTYVARPMFLQFEEHKSGMISPSRLKVQAPDWAVACDEWVARRKKHA